MAAAASKMDEKDSSKRLPLSTFLLFNCSEQSVASDVKCDEPDEDEITKLLEGDGKEDEE